MGSRASLGVPFRMGSGPFGIDPAAYDKHGAGAVTTSYTPDFLDGNLHTMSISGTVTLTNPINTGGTNPMVLIVNNAAGGSLVTPGATTLIDTDETGVYYVSILQIAENVFYFFKGVEGHV